MSGNFSDKLKSLGVKVGARDLARTQPRHAHGIEEVLPGRLLSTPYGQAFVVEQVYPPEYRHGRAGLRATASLKVVAEWAHEARLAECGMDSFCFLDTETTGLAGGTGTFAFLVGVAKFDGDHLHLAQFFMRDPVEEPALLAALTAFLTGSDALVTFNGKGFDVPLLNTRYVFHGRPTPLDRAAHLDLLPLARRLWRERLPSRALGALEVDILGASRTEQDVPSWLIPQLYFDYLRSGDARPLKGVFYHNAMDVVAMAALLTHVAAMLADPLHGPIDHGLDLYSIAKMTHDLGDLDGAVACYQRALECDLPAAAMAEATRRLALLQRQRGNTQSALELWRQAATSGQIFAFVELAKYFEHERRDYNEAAHWTRSALALVTRSESTQHTRRMWFADLSHRLSRLEAKIRRISEGAKPRPASRRQTVRRAAKASLQTQT